MPQRPIRLFNFRHFERSREAFAVTLSCVFFFFPFQVKLFRIVRVALFFLPGGT